MTSTFECSKKWGDYQTKYTLITKNINTMLIVLCVNSYNGLRFL